MNSYKLTYHAPICNGETMRQWMYLTARTDAEAAKAVRRLKRKHPLTLLRPRLERVEEIKL